MGVITKRADELKPGDMLMGVGQVVEWVGKAERNSIEVRMKKGPEFFTQAGATFDVFVPEQTPAQQHAEELLALVESMPVTDKITALLDKIHPPALPTLNEVMTSLVGLSDPAVTAAESKRRIEALVAKARRAGWGA